ncbi:hypothetical protein D3C76_958580 [compost metagenome]
MSASPPASVASPNNSDMRSSAPACSINVVRLWRAVAWLGKSSPSKLGNCPKAITTAAPSVKPSTTECETKFTSAPKRSMPSSHWNNPAIKVSNRMSVM